MVYSINCHKSTGFTLIETLVALLVVAIAYAGVATAVSQFVDQRLMLVERHTSHRIAWNRLMEQYLVAQSIQLDERNFAENKGETELRGNRWRWQVTEEKTASGDLVRYQVDVYSMADSAAQEAGGRTGTASATGSLSAYFVP